MATLRQGLPTIDEEGKLTADDYSEKQLEDMDQSIVNKLQDTLEQEKVSVNMLIEYFERLPEDLSVKIKVKNDKGDVTWLNLTTLQEFQENAIKYGVLEDENAYEILSFSAISVEGRKRIVRHRKAGGVDWLGLEIKSRSKSAYFIPSNNHCLTKCFLKNLEDWGEPISDSRVKELMEKTGNESNIYAFNYALTDQEKDFKIKALHSHDTCTETNTIVDFVPVLVDDKRVGYHSVLVRDIEKYQTPVLNIKFDSGISVLADPKNFKELKVNPKTRKVGYTLTFDFECFTEEKVMWTPAEQEAMDIWGELFGSVPSFFKTQHVPYMCGLHPMGRMPFVNMDDPVDVVRQLLDSLESTSIKNDACRYTNYLIGFNNSRYDTQLMFDFWPQDRPQWKVNPMFIGSQTEIKQVSFSLDYENKKGLKKKSLWMIRDASNYVSPMSLKTYCQTWNPTGRQKDDLDIGLFLTKETVRPNLEQISKYCRQDCICLLSAFHCHKTKVEKLFPEMGPMLNYMSLPTHAYSIAMNAVEDVYVSPRREIQEFCREAIFGGKVHVGLTYSDKEMIAVDANSLYASAMLQEYPTGMPYQTKTPDLENKFSICRVKVQRDTDLAIPLLYQRIGPNTTVKNEKFRATYTSVEINQARKYGNDLITIEDAMEWPTKAKVFEKVIGGFMEKRATEKNLMKSDPENREEHNAKQLIYKLMGNSCYGQMTMRPFTTKMNVRSKKYDVLEPGEKVLDMLAGQILTETYSKEHNNTKPTHLGCFILSHSKAIMNTMVASIDGFKIPGRVAYMDTDSMYIEKQYYTLIEQAGLIHDTAPCKFKNDYGDSVIIEFSSYGKKLKCCKMMDPQGKIHVKTTLKGINEKWLQNQRQEASEKGIDFDTWMIHLFDTVLKDCKPLKAKYTGWDRNGFKIQTLETERNITQTWQNEYTNVPGTNILVYKYRKDRKDD
jgi:5'(3')-deoxyribonucleotidase